MSLVRRSIVLSAVERYGNLVLTLLSVVVLSRLLTPHEFGIYAITTSIAGVLCAVREFGGANYIIQKQDLSERCVRTAFTINCVISGVLIALLFAVRDGMASFFDEEGIRAGLAVSACNFLVLPFSDTALALLRREMAFDVIALCSLIGTTVIVVTSIGLAAIGFSFMGPVWGLVAGSLAQAVLYCLCRRDIRIFLPSLKGWWDVLRFGAYSSATTMINSLNQWSPQLIVGRVLDLTAVGLYARSVNVTVMFDRLVTDALKPVILPVITRQARDRAQLKRFYLNAIELISVLQWPFMSVTALLAEPIVALLFGPTWAGAAPLAQLLSIASLAMFAACLTYPVLVAVGRVRDTLIVNLLSIPPSLLLLFVASHYGVEWVAASALLAWPLQAAIAWWFIAKYVDIRPLDLLKASRKSAIATVCAVLPVFTVLGTQEFSFDISVPVFIAAVLTAAGGWCLGVVMTNHPIWAQLLRVVPAMPLARELRRARKVRAP